MDIWHHKRNSISVKLKKKSCEPWAKSKHEHISKYAYYISTTDVILPHKIVGILYKSKYIIMQNPF